MDDSPSRDPDSLHRAIWETMAKRVPRVGAFRGDAIRVSLGPDGLGLDSVQTLEILIVLEDRFGVRVTPEWIEHHDLTISSLAELIQSETTEAR